MMKNFSISNLAKDRLYIVKLEAITAKMAVMSYLQ
jgi:hypothetical protein